MAYGILETANGHIALAGVLPDKRKTFYDAVGVPELIDDERFAPIIYDRGTENVIRVVSTIFQEKTTEEWGQILDAMEVRYAPVNDYEQAANDNLVLK